MNVTVDESSRISMAQILVYELRVRDAMTRTVVTAAPSQTLRSIQLLMKAHRISGVPVTENGTLAGIVSIEDIINALDRGYINDPAEQWMTRNPLTLRDHYSLARAVAEFDRQGFGRFPVLNTQRELAGILTQGDVIACLMHHLEKRADEAVTREAANQAARLGEKGKVEPVVVRARIKSGAFDSAGMVSQRMRQVMRARGIDPDMRRRAAIIAYEAETNIIIHSLGGDLRASIMADKVIIEAVDEGPGIENVDLALQEGWSTAGPLARELGFGAGMGLPNIKKCADKFEIHSELGVGTTVRCEVYPRKLAST